MNYCQYPRFERKSACKHVSTLHTLSYKCTYFNIPHLPLCICTSSGEKLRFTKYVQSQWAFTAGIQIHCQTSKTTGWTCFTLISICYAQDTLEDIALPYLHACIRNSMPHSVHAYVWYSCAFCKHLGPKILSLRKYTPGALVGSRRKSWCVCLYLQNVFACPRLKKMYTHESLARNNWVYMSCTTICAQPPKRKICIILRLKATRSCLLQVCLRSLCFLCF